MLKIALKNFPLLENPQDEKDGLLVWRRFRVSGGITLNALQDRIIQSVMGLGRRYHSYYFCDLRDGACFGPQGEAYIDDMHKSMQGLADLLSKPGDLLRYTYDLGDQFEHVITLEEIVPDDETFELIDGALAGPPEDSNGCQDKGTSGYYQLLRDVKQKGADAMTEALREAAGAATVKPSQLDSRGRFQPFRFEVMEHRYAVQAALSEPLGAHTASMPRLQTYKFSQDTGFSSSSWPAPFGTQRLRTTPRRWG